MLSQRMRSVPCRLSIPLSVDRGLMERQRYNIFTIFMKAVRKMKMEKKEKLLDNTKPIIANTFYWAMANMENPITMMTSDVAYRMPGVLEGEQFSIEFPVWAIADDLNCAMHREPVESVLPALLGREDDRRIRLQHRQQPLDPSHRRGDSQHRRRMLLDVLLRYEHGQTDPRFTCPTR